MSSEISKTSELRGELRAARSAHPGEGSGHRESSLKQDLANAIQEALSDVFCKFELELDNV